MEMENELYIFSNNPVPPVRELVQSLVREDYIDLSVYLNPDMAVAPNFSGTPKHGVSELDRYKAEYPEYKFVLVYRLSHSHCEFNLPEQRKRA